jgi:hypothetical protein
VSVNTCAGTAEVPHEALWQSFVGPYEERFGASFERIDLSINALRRNFESDTNAMDAARACAAEMVEPPGAEPSLKRSID